jgi:CBS domain containing-hemolysin-like protein
MAEQGVKGAHRAIVLASDPGRFLSTVQIGITLIGIIAGAVFRKSWISRKFFFTCNPSGIQSRYRPAHPKKKNPLSH